MKKIGLIISSLLFTISYSQFATPNGGVISTSNPNTGNVGIGNNSPLERLDINGSLLLRNYENTVGGGSKIHFTSFGDNNTPGPIIKSSLIFASGGASKSDLILSSYNEGYKNELILHNGFVGIGENTPTDKLTVTAGHMDTSILLHAANGGNPHAYLSLWASEPSTTYNGVGIGNNVRNYVGNTAFVKIDNSKGSSYLRLLDSEINFNLISASGIRTTPFIIRANDSFFQGKLEAKEVKVTTTPTADFVFEEDYQLPTLESVEKHIKAKKHLPEIASAKVMEQEGVNIGEFQIKLLQKIEELTLYSIEQNKQIKSQSEKIQTLETENRQIRSLLDRVEKLEQSSFQK